MPIAIIVAVAGENQVIGRDGDLPWHFKSDLAFFKEKTTGHAVLMGRVTYNSILARLGKPLPGRRNIVLTTDKNFADNRVSVMHDLHTIKNLIKGDEWLFIIGGAKVYEQTLKLADVLYVTHIGMELTGDAFFPTIDPALWRLSEERCEMENSTALRFCTYSRITN